MTGSPLVIVNPVAGGGRARRFWERSAVACREAGLEVDVVHTERRGDAANLAAQGGDRLVIAVGGDGTAHEVVNGLLRRPANRPPRFGALMYGTGSDLVRTIPSPRRPDDVPAWLRQDRWRRIDAGRIGSSTGRRYFINAADVGIGAEVVRRAAAGPARLGGTVNFLGAAVLSLMVHRNTTVRIRADDGSVEEARVRTIAVANGSYLGAGMHIAPDARPDDGLFDVVIIGDFGRFEAIRHLPRLYRGTHVTLRKVRVMRAKRLEVDAVEPVGIETDGEPAGATPAVFEVVPLALNVLAW